MPEIYLIVDEDSAYLWHRKGTSLNPLFLPCFGQDFHLLPTHGISPSYGKRKGFYHTGFSHHLAGADETSHTAFHTSQQKRRTEISVRLFEMYVRSVQLVRTCVAIPTSGQHISVVIDIHAFSGTLSFIPTPHPEIFVFPNIYAEASGFSFVSLTDVIISVVI